ncbi:uncharacterized protein K02A2.6-like [Galleria mellonella]|nr:uncharacterized protein K02A2.6-like [Galleria mellonella]
MDWDTGSKFSIINTKFWKQIGSPQLKRSPPLKAYGNNDFKLKPRGLTEVSVEIQGKQKILPVIVMKTSDPMLFGLDWSEMFGMEFPEAVYSIKAINEQQTLQNILTNYATLFNNKLGKVKNYQVNIHIKPGTEAKHFPPRPVKFSIKKNIELELDRLVQEGIITKVDPNITPVEWSTPTVNVVKPNGQIRICGDYRVTINPALITHLHPVPLFDQLRQQLANGEKFSKIDLKDAYLQFEIAPESKKYLTITTHKGYFQYNRMPFGIATAPSIFQHYLEKLLDNIPNTAVYFDDIAVTGKNDSEHLSTLTSVLKRLLEAGLKVNLKKCSFLQPEIEYLGHIIDARGVRPTKTKIDAIAKAPAPNNTKELRSFLGMVNFYERFIPHLHTLCSDLHDLTSSRKKWKWTKELQTAFEKVKTCITKTRPLIAYDDKRMLYLACDASEKGLGAVLFHKEHNIEQPVAYASRKLKPAESKYSVIDREALAIYFGIKKFDQFLRGVRFTLITDHKPLIYLLGPQRNLPKLVNNRLVRWALAIGCYNYHIEYRKGEHNILADFLSRMPNPDQIPSEGELTVHKIGTRLQAIKMIDLTLSEKLIKEETGKDPVLREVSNHIKLGWKNQCNSHLKPYYRKREELAIENKIIMWGGRIVIPQGIQKAVLHYLHRGHPGTSAMRALARFYVWWPSIDEDIDRYIKLCHKCQENRPNDPELPIYSWSIPEKNWERIHIDFAGPFEGKYWVVVVDALSKWIEVRPMTKTTTVKLCAKLDGIFTTFGLPKIIVSDNGPQFTSHEFENYCKQYGILHIRVSPYHPRSNGLAERLVRTFKTRLSASNEDGANLKQRLRNFLFSYRNTPHSTTGKSPAQIMFGHQLNCVFDNLRPDLRKTLNFKQLQTNLHGDQPLKEFKSGDPVYIRTRNESTWHPATVTLRTHRYSYLVQTPDGVEKRRHADHIRSRAIDEAESTKIGGMVKEPSQDSQASMTPLQAPTSEIQEPSPEQTQANAPITPLQTSPCELPQEWQQLTSIPLTKEAYSTAEETAVPLRRSVRTRRPPRRLLYD